LYDGYLVLSHDIYASHVKLEHHNQVQAIAGSDGYGSNYTKEHALIQVYLRDLDGLQDNEREVKELKDYLVGLDRNLE
jgi:hypothetical protein